MIPRTTSVLFGVSFILAFLFYGTGSGLALSLTSQDNAVLAVAEQPHLMVISFVLTALLHSVVNIALPVLMVPHLKQINASMAYGYLSMAIAGTVTLIMGSIMLLMLLPLGQAVSVGASYDNAEILADSLIYGASVSYQLGMALWGVGGILLSLLLSKTHWVPRFFPIWGVVGYLVFMAGTQLELMGYTVGTLLALPGGLFELTLSGYLIVTGLKRGRSSTLSSPAL